MAGINQLWDRLEAHLQSHAPATLGFLNPPADRQRIRNAETRLGRSFPSDLVDSLMVHDGQPPIDRPPCPIALIPKVCDPDDGAYVSTWGLFASVDQIVWSTELRGQIVVEHWQLTEQEVRGPVRHDGHWEFINFVDSGSGDVLAVDLNPASGGHPGQVVAVNHDDPIAIRVIAPSYSEWFHQLVTRYESGRFTITGTGAVDQFDPHAKDGD